MPDRRHAVPFDPDQFAKRAAAGDRLDMRATFHRVWATNHWAGHASRSGAGSDLAQTAAIRAALAPLCGRLGVRTLLDAPCGDGHWMAATDLGGVRYIGADLIPEVVAAHRSRAPSDRSFLVLDLATTALPAADLLLCRDALVHLAFADIARVTTTLARSSITWILTTTFPDQPVNHDVTTGDWRPLNLTAPPFRWPPPHTLINEACTEADGAFADKSLGLWRLADLPLAS